MSRRKLAWRAFRKDRCTIQQIPTLQSMQIKKFLSLVHWLRKATNLYGTKNNGIHWQVWDDWKTCSQSEWVKIMKGIWREEPMSLELFAVLWDKNRGRYENARARVRCNTGTWRQRLAICRRNRFVGGRGDPAAKSSDRKTSSWWRPQNACKHAQD